jgi:hypothetical protein
MPTTVSMIGTESGLGIQPSSGANRPSRTGIAPPTCTPTALAAAGVRTVSVVVAKHRPATKRRCAQTSSR